MEIEKPLTIEEADAFYEWFLDLYGRKRAKAELKQCGKEGWRKGQQEARVNIALNMLKLKLHPDVINKATGMSMADILQLAKDNNLLDA